ncbi:restriction endonuclease subunit S [Enterococcus faecium]|uniref:restriction endonuclease subunit S n=1 Tax=Enterococcus TaxID=1350 RepID=UPI0008A968D7|nr:restriction endonuclease subunit S [Enterococcus faecium]MDT2348169.1 restriction endonuclease subunit S [Enterococcus faecium]MDW3698639.1 restriction endonuclease subunit S [Enterococcus faecium]MDW3721422.1 restriction endonuclease subunit S [Enterococcus faecium]OHO48933.1 restriction endonuclease subunit S [Enterococcus sp. HMSC035C10]
MSKDKQPEIRFPGFTDEWEQRKFNNCFNFPVSTNSLSRAMLNYDNGEIKNIHYGDILIKYSTILNVKEDEIPYITGGELEKYKSNLLENQDLIFADAAEDESVGKAVEVSGITNENLVSGLHTIVARVKGEKAPFFWGYYINSDIYHRQLLRLMQGSKVSAISKGNLQKTNVSFPNRMKEQQKIGTFFKQLDDTIALHQRKLDLLKETKKGFLQKMFPKNGAKVPEIRFPGFTEDWEERRLNDFISGDISDGDWIEKEHIKDEGKYRIIQTGNIGNGVYIDKEKSAKYMDQNSFDILKANEIFPGDLLVSRLAEPAGRTVILPNIEDRMVTAVDVTILRQNENFDAYFLLSQMNTSKILNKVSKNVSGTSHKRISRKNLEKVTIDSTSIEEQNKIGAFFKQLDDTIALHQRKLDLLKETKKGFLQKMFI